MATTTRGGETDVSIIPFEKRADFIRRQIVESLGTPAGLLRVQVNPLGSDRYRANVLVGKSPAWARIADSFYLTADPEGKIMESSPRIERVY
jgi:hypothetical protein